MYYFCSRKKKKKKSNHHEDGIFTDIQLITASNIFFYKNHPIRFVTVVGLIVAVTDYYRRTILTLDDSSGATIEVAVLKSENPKPNHDLTITAPPQGANSDKSTEAAESSAEPIHLSTTARTPLDITNLVPGALVMIKGTLSVFRSTMQLQLERFFPVPDTTVELRFLADRMQYLADVLSVPWMLTDEEVEQLRLETENDVKKFDGNRKRKERQVRKRVEREEKDHRRIVRAYEAEERKREKEAKRCREAGKELMTDIKKRRRG